MSGRLTRLREAPDLSHALGAASTSTATLGINDNAPHLGNGVAWWLERIAEHSRPWQPEFLTDWAAGIRLASGRIASFGAGWRPWIAAATLVAFAALAYATRGFGQLTADQRDMLRALCLVAYAQNAALVAAFLFGVGALFVAAFVTVLVLAVDATIVLVTVYVVAWLFCAMFTRVPDDRRWGGV